MIKEMLGMSPGILSDLHKDHQEVNALMKQILASEDAQERTTLFKEMMTNLLAHAKAEQNVLYKKMEKGEDEESRKFAFEGTNEHQIVEQQLELLNKARDKMSEKWTSQMTVLSELVNHHVDEEESTGFTQARKEFETEQLEKMRDQFERQKEKLKAEVG